MLIHLKAKKNNPFGWNHQILEESGKRVRKIPPEIRASPWFQGGPTNNATL